METKQLRTIEQNVYELLLKKPKLRYNRRELEWEYWKAYDNLKFGITKEMWLSQGQPGQLTKYTALDRAIRKVFQDYPNLRPQNDIKRYEEAETFKQAYGKKEN